VFLQEIAHFVGFSAAHASQSMGHPNLTRFWQTLCAARMCLAIGRGQRNRSDVCEPIKDEGKRERFREFWESEGSQLPSFPLDRAVCERDGALLLFARAQRRTVPLGYALHSAVAELEGLTVLTVDTEHFKTVGVPALNPLPGLRSS
jgi:predicted nucleic acid-binding protein